MSLRPCRRIGRFCGLACVCAPGAICRASITLLARPSSGGAPPSAWWSACLRSAFMCSECKGVMSIWSRVREHTHSIRMINVSCYAGEWEHFLYVGKIAFFGWALHYRTCSSSPLPSPLPFSVYWRDETDIVAACLLTHSTLPYHGPGNLHPSLCTSP